MNHFESLLFLFSFLFSFHVYKKKREKRYQRYIENVKLFFFDKIRQLKLAIAILEIPFRDWKILDAYYPEKEFYIYIYILKKE